MGDALQAQRYKTGKIKWTKLLQRNYKIDYSKIALESSSVVQGLI